MENVLKKLLYLSRSLISIMRLIQYCDLRENQEVSIRYERFMKNSENSPTVALPH